MLLPFTFSVMFKFSRENLFEISTETKIYYYLLVNLPVRQLTSPFDKKIYVCYPGIILLFVNTFSVFGTISRE